MNYKKGISSVVVTALLLVVAVVAVISFQNWFQTYSSSMFTQTEQQSSSTLSTSGIENLIGNELYFKNNQIGINITITKVKINEIDCNISGNYSFGISTLNVTNCTHSLTTSTPEIVVFTNNEIYSKKVYLNDLTQYLPQPQDCLLNGTIVTHLDNYSFYDSSFVSIGNSCVSQTRTCNNGILNGSSNYNVSSCNVFNCSLFNLIGGEWITVPGNAILGTSDFCVMKFEAKNVGGVATSQAALTPWVSINQYNARANCSALGSKYHLITNAEWTTIARNIENDSTNWANGVKGSTVASLGGLYGGNLADNSAVACGNSTVLDGNTQGTNCLAGLRNKRTHNISGMLIWDLGGNVWEWNNDTCSQGDPWYTLGAIEWNNANVNGQEKNLAGPIGSYTTTNGVGRYDSGCTVEGNGFMKGAGGSGWAGGIFMIGLGNSPNLADSSVGFRCVYTP